MVILPFSFHRAGLWSVSQNCYLFFFFFWQRYNSKIRLSFFSKSKSKDKEKMIKTEEVSLENTDSCGEQQPNIEKYVKN